MPNVRITKRTVDALSASPGGDVLYWDSGKDSQPGLGVRVTPKGAKSFIFQYRLKGFPARRLTIGKYGRLTVEQARRVAQDHSYSVAKNLDPVEAQKKKARDARTLGFEDYLDRFVTVYLKTEWEDSWQEAEKRLRNHALPKLKGKSMPEITSTDIGDVIDAVRSRKALARNLYVLLKLLFDFAAAPERKDIDRSPLQGMKAPPNPKARKRVLSPDEMIAAWKASYDLSDPFGAFVRLLFATLQRRTEVADLPWKECNEDARRWLIDGERAKNDTDHLVHLNDLAMAELEGRGWKRRGLALSTNGESGISGFSKMKKKLDEAMLPILQKMADDRAKALGEDPHTVTLDRWTLHDIRRSGTTALQALGFPVEVTEKVINHRSGEVSGIKAVYNLYAYENEKRAALDAWGSYLDRLIKGADTASNVVALAEARA